MQDDRSGNFAGEDAGATPAPERVDRSERERDLAAKSLRERDTSLHPRRDVEPARDDGEREER